MGEVPNSYKYQEPQTMYRSHISNLKLLGVSGYTPTVQEAGTGSLNTDMEGGK